MVKLTKIKILTYTTNFPFSDDFVQMCVDYLRDYPLLFIVMVGIPLFLLISFIYLMRPETEEPKKRKKKKKEKKDKDS